MHKIGAVIAVAIVLAGAPLAWRYVAPAAHDVAAKEATGWIPDMRVSARQQSMLRVAREFGAWRYGCRRPRGNGTEVARIAPIQNLGLMQSDLQRRFGSCFVGIVMRKAGAKAQFVALMLHATEDGSLLGDVSYSLGPIAIPSAILSPRTGGQNLNVSFRKTVATGLVARCPRSTCLTQIAFQPGDLATLRDGETIVFSLPRPRGGKAVEVRVPAGGLHEALAALDEQRL